MDAVAQFAVTDMAFAPSAELLLQNAQGQAKFSFISASRLTGANSNGMVAHSFRQRQNELSSASLQLWHRPWRSCSTGFQQE
jgi:hypothetical protein